ncbi:hypothetical protein CXG81DRAFT_6952, partial [Caulochytrium protostelioides]
VAIKIVRNIPKYREAAAQEIRLLMHMQQQQRPGTKALNIPLLSWFDYQGHICMVFPLLATSLFDFVKSNHFTPLPLAHIQSLAHQMFTSVALLHDLQIIHTDLKPENMMLTSYVGHPYVLPQRPAPSRLPTMLAHTDLTVIDFGSAIFESQYHASVVSTRHYRAPEIILNLGWSFPCDIWSLGCILVELFTGETLFPSHNNIHHLHLMQNECGPLPYRMGQAHHRFWDGTLCPVPRPAPSDPRRGKSAWDGRPPAREMLRVSRTEEAAQLADLVRHCLMMDPARRCTAKQALAHPFF